MNKFNFKSLVAVLLTVVMVFSIVPMFAVSAEEPAATISFADKANRTEFDTEHQVWVQNGITVTNNKASSTSNVADYANPARFYAKSDLTVAYPGMTKIVVTAGNANYAKVWSDTNKDANATVTLDGSTATVTFATPVDSFTLETLSAQSRVASIAVYAESVAAPCTHANTTVVNAKEATEAEEGYTGDTKCTDCGDIIANGEAIPKKEASSAASEATISFADKANRTVFTTEQQVWVQNGITVTNDKGSSTSNVADYGNPARFYKNSDLTVAYTGMTKITFTCNTAAYATSLSKSLSAAGITAAVSGKEVTITFTEATDSVTVTLTDGQVRVDALTVYTGSSSTPDVPEIVIPATLAEQIAEAQKLANKNYLPYQSTITGTVTDDPQASSYNEGQYKFTVSDGTNTLLCYFVPVTGGTPKKGDTVTVTGYLTAYNGSAQFDDSAAGTWVKAGEAAPEPKPEDPAADSTLTIVEALALGLSKAHNTYTAGKYYVVGEIVEVYNTTYGNMKIKDAEGNILTIYGTYSADGSTRYDAMEVKPVVGDTVKVYGIIGQYNGTAQIKNGWLVEVTSATPDTPDTPVNPPKTGDALIVMIPALMLAGVAVLVVASRKRRFN